MSQPDIINVRTFTQAAVSAAALGGINHFYYNRDSGVSTSRSFLNAEVALQAISTLAMQIVFPMIEHMLPNTLANLIDTVVKPALTGLIMLMFSKMGLFNGKTGMAVFLGSSASQLTANLVAPKLDHLFDK